MKGKPGLDTRWLLSGPARRDGSGAGWASSSFVERLDIFAYALLWPVGSVSAFSSLSLDGGGADDTAGVVEGVEAAEVVGVAGGAVGRAHMIPGAKAVVAALDTAAGMTAVVEPAAGVAGVVDVVGVAGVAGVAALLASVTGTAVLADTAGCSAAGRVHLPLVVDVARDAATVHPEHGIAAAAVAAAADQIEP